MKQIRQNVFETNSSSTHCLCVSKHCIIRNYSNLDEDIFNKKYEINFDPYAEQVNRYMEGQRFSSVQDKLNYFACIIRMYNIEDRNDPNTIVGKFLKLLEEVFPNTDFSEVKTAPYDYSYEDGDCLLDEPWDCKERVDIEPFLDKINLKYLFQFGEIWFGNRDDESFFNFVDDIRHDPNKITVEVSG